ncbi:hypothetical protein RUM43_001994 [Polyplax serrata]|uniref:Synaptonemal complex protein 2-like n=1 Tax=Polyplax serrata TaxID=468196 RepID=A0AAN8PLT8_POLSC
MEDRLTNYLINVQYDITNVKHLRDYLDSNSNASFECSLTWSIIEVFNNILFKFTTSELLEVDGLDTILDSFYRVASNTNDETPWNNFGFELGVVCLKILSVIERSNSFEILFLKLLSVINVFSEHTSDVWKAVARQILNIFLNKRLSFYCFEMGLKLYVSIMRNIDEIVLHKFVQQNFHLLKTFSNLVQRAGDFETQMNIMELVFLHVSNEKHSIQDFFMESKTDVQILFQNLRFTDFEDDCRTYLNAMNSALVERQVYSVKCSKLYVGGRCLEPPRGSKVFWMDANRRSERLSTKCSDFQAGSLSQTLVFIQFIDIVTLQLDKQPSNRYRLVIKAKNLSRIVKSVKTDEITCIDVQDGNSGRDVTDFVKFLEEILERECKTQKENLPEICNDVSIDCVEVSTEGNDTISTLNKKIRKINNIIPEALDLLTRVENKDMKNSRESTLDLTDEGTAAAKRSFGKSFDDYQFGSVGVNFFSKSPSPINPIISSGSDERQKFVPESEELSPRSFVESLNKNLRLDSPNTIQSFERTMESVIFQSTEEEKVTHKLFRSPETIFCFLDAQSAELENVTVASHSNKIVKSNKGKKSFKTKKAKTTETAGDKNILSKESMDSHSDHYFRGASLDQQRKPSLPKLTRNLRSNSKLSKKNIKVTSVVDSKPNKKPQKKSNAKVKVNNNTTKEHTTTIEEKIEEMTEKQTTICPKEPPIKPSLLDPDGYAYKKWKNPSTSERSKFWLNKLGQLKHKQKSAEKVFDFTDESDPDTKYRNTRNKRKCKKSQTTRKAQTHSKNVKSVLKSKKGPQKQVKELFRAAIQRKRINSVEQKEKKKWFELKGKAETPDRQNVDYTATVIESNRNINLHDQKEGTEANMKTNDISFIEDSLEINKKGQQEVTNEAEERVADQTGACGSKSYPMIYNDLIVQRHSSFDSLEDETNSYQIISDFTQFEVKPEKNLMFENIDIDIELSDVEIDPMEDNINSPEADTWQSIKHSDCENLLLGSKSKRNELNDMLAILRVRLQRLQKTARQETDEIIQAFSSGVTRLINRIHRKNLIDVVGYLTQANDVISELRETDLEAVQQRTEKAFAYHRAKCSVRNFSDSVRSNVSTIHECLDSLMPQETPACTSISTFSERLTRLIEKEIDKTIDREVRSFKDKIRQLAPNDYV